MPVLMIMVLWTMAIVLVNYFDKAGETLEISLVLLPGLPVLFVIGLLTGPAVNLT